MKNSTKFWTSAVITFMLFCMYHAYPNVKELVCIYLVACLIQAIAAFVNSELEKLYVINVPILLIYAITKFNVWLNRQI